MEDALTDLLLAYTPLTALVGQDVTPSVRLQATGLPAVVITRVSGARDYHMGGASGLTQSRMQIDCYGSTWPQAKSVARAVIARLSGFNGRTTASVIRSAMLDSERHFFEGEDPETVHRISLDFNVWASEA
jgi:hypothetical protein